MEFSSLTGSGKEGATNVALGRDVSLSKAVKAALVLSTDREGMRAGDIVLKSQDSGHSPPL